MIAYRVFKKFLADNQFKKDLMLINTGDIAINCDSTKIFLRTVMKLGHVNKLREICGEILKDGYFNIEKGSLKTTISKDMKEISFGPGFYLELIRKELIEKITNKG
jgi:hypothetical protein